MWIMAMSSCKRVKKELASCFYEMCLLELKIPSIASIRSFYLKERPYLLLSARKEFYGEHGELGYGGRAPTEPWGLGHCGLQGEGGDIGVGIGGGTPTNSGGGYPAISLIVTVVTLYRIKHL
ncbi:hypothetical protein VNO78_08044 [Psophocarpus tetragonolobus]|uniref:Uncharacterized protein n=1 Tax=Psophocarpus tetragonolobus TaxID=3891 RepID=A0AAN9XSH6_PSOTE